MLAVRLLPRRAGLRLFSALGNLAFSLYSKERDRSLSNISLAFPDIDQMIVRAMAKGSFRSLGRNAYDAMNRSYRMLGAPRRISISKRI